VEDIIRSKIPLHRKKSKIIDKKPSAESVGVASPASVDGFSPLTSLDPVGPSPILLQRGHSDVTTPPLSSPPEVSLASRKGHETKRPEAELRSAPSPNQQPSLSSSSPTLNIAKGRDLAVFNISLNLSSDSSDHTETPPPSAVHPPIINRIRLLSEENTLRSTSFDLSETNRASCDSSDGSLSVSPSPALLALLSQPLVTKTKEDLRAEFASFRQNSKLKLSLSGSAESTDMVSSLPPDVMEGGREDEEESVSSYASDEIQSVVSTDDEAADEADESSHQQHPPVHRAESIPEGDEDHSDEEEAMLRIAVAQSLSAETDGSSHEHISSRPTKQRLSASSSTASLDSTKSSSKKRMSIASTSSAVSSGTVSGSKQRSKSILSNTTQSSSGNPALGWNTSLKPVSSSSKLVSSSVSSSASASTAKSTQKSVSKRQSLSVNSRASSLSSHELDTTAAAPFGRSLTKVDKQRRSISGATERQMNR
jgi:hypothetical protein